MEAQWGGVGAFEREGWRLLEKGGGSLKKGCMEFIAEGWGVF